jgi:hypothetical protein
MRTVNNADSAAGQRSIDALPEVYMFWREQCRAVRHAYQSWVDSDRAKRGLAYAAYAAALDREEHAARAYADHIERARRIST